MTRRSYIIKRDAGDGSVRVISLEGARAFLAEQRITDRATPCCYGHLDCSSYHGGPCLDETLSNFPQADDDR